MTNVFGVPVFFIVFRECLEGVIIVSVLLSFLKQSLGQPSQDPAIYKRLRRQVWAGSLTGILIAMIIGGAFIGVFYGLGHDIWAESEDLWEGIFYLIASIIITIMGLAILRINKTKEKWRVKIAEALVAKTKYHDTASKLGEWSRRYAMFLLPFVTTLREGLEAVVFVGGVSLGLPATAFPIPVITGILAGLLVGYLIYRSGNYMTIQYFLIASTCVLYLIAAGMFSKAVWSLQFHRFAQQVGGDVAESGDGPGSYNIDQTVWHVNCCNPERDNGWDVFNALLGWQNTATYGSVISYNAYWIFIMVAVTCMLYEERTGGLPLQKPFLRFLSKIPGFRSYATRKLNPQRREAGDVVAQVDSNAFTHGLQRPVSAS
ncbi:high-affinity iron transporter [Cladophialophora yegresii CBS 114405]|uniref:High-affinity iron transporter n=1 Tax=Cladophialophora yegresii CBS 114405 TaxID=1182544 RepID=W9W5E7_9EURO|nr:high-affinity iron transporter [Cladophialophora yegresii CBS 114405]EXJ59761.1 high-affinity iron transporter [Cladophialophora yegresii CBS 114405]